MRSMKVGNACVRALLRRKCCVRRRLAKGVFFVATSMPAVRCYSRSRDQVEIDQKRGYISVNGRRPFPVYRRCGDDGG